MTETNDNPKDRWDKASVIIAAVATVALPGTLAIVGKLASDRLEAHEANQKNRELDQQAAAQESFLLKEFYEAYAVSSPPEECSCKRRLSRSFVQLLKKSELRQGLYDFVIWDLLNETQKKTPFFEFDTDQDKWHFFGDVLEDCHTMHSNDGTVTKFDNWWKNVKETALRCEHNAKELNRLLDWLEKTYLPTGYGTGGLTSLQPVSATP